MPRANRYRLAGHVWHLTERGHGQQFRLQFARDRQAWITGRYQARQRDALSVLNDQVTSNHMPRLGLDRGEGESAQSRQLIAGCVGRASTRRTRRPGAFWDECSHATAGDTDEHLARCFTSIDLTRVRAGVVGPPGCGLTVATTRSSNLRPSRYRIIDRQVLCELLGTADDKLAQLQNEWIEAALATGRTAREPQWSEAIAVGRRSFVERVQTELGMRARYRCVEELAGASVLREPAPPYGHRFGDEMATLRSKSSCNLNDLRIDSMRWNGQTRQPTIPCEALAWLSRQDP